MKAIVAVQDDRILIAAPARQDFGHPALSPARRHLRQSGFTPFEEGELEPLEWHSLSHL